MNFVILEPEDFRNFAAKSPYKSFYQTPEIAKLREKNGWTAYYFGVKSGNTLKAAAMAVAKPTFLGKSTFYLPGGPLLDLEDAPLTDFFFSHLRKYAKSHNGYLIHIEPYYELVERDKYGAPVEGGFNHAEAKQNLKKAGFLPCATSDEPQYAFVMEIDGRTPEQILADFKRNTRNHVRKAEKKGVKIRELKREELGIFKQITESTSNRRHFQDKPLKYYEQMYDLFAAKGEVKFLVAEGPVGSGNTSSRGTRDNGSERSEEPHDDGRDEASREERVSLPLSAAMFMLYGDEVIYLFSGSDEQYMKEYNAQYLIQWHMIKFAAENNYKRYNFYGINGLPDKSSKDYGIYDFKKGFAPTHGHVTELIGAHEAPVNYTFYTLHRLLHKLKHR